MTEEETPVASGSICSSLPVIVVLAQDHVGFCEAGATDVGQHGAAARAFEAAVVPVAVQRVQQETLHDLATTTRAHLHRRTIVVVAVIIVVVVVTVEVVMVRMVHGASRGWSSASKWLVLMVWVLVVVVVWSRMWWWARAPWGVVVVMMVRPQDMAVAHVGAVRLRSGVMCVWRMSVLRVPMVIVVVRGRRMWGIQLRVGMVVGIHTGDGARSQLAGSSSQICNRAQHVHQTAQRLGLHLNC